MSIGQVVFAKCGRDKGKAFVVINVQEEYLYLVDGILRTLNKPKKKKVKHVRPVNHIVNLEVAGRALQDADIRKELKAFATRLMPQQNAAAFIREGGRSRCQKTM